METVKLSSYDPTNAKKCLVVDKEWAEKLTRNLPISQVIPIRNGKHERSRVEVHLDEQQAGIFTSGAEEIEKEQYLWHGTVVLIKDRVFWEGKETVVYYLCRTDESTRGVKWTEDDVDFGWIHTADLFKDN